MKKLLAVIAILLLGAATFNVVLAADASKTFKPFPIYSDGKSPDNHFAPSGWMGDYGDLKVNTEYAVNPHSGTTCIQWKYNGKGANGAGWAGVFWQNPANNWGAKKGGYDLTGAKKLVFWARGEKGGEIIAEVGVGGITGKYADTDKVSTGPIKLTKEWQQYEIDISKADLSYISGGFFWTAKAEDEPEGGITFYLDDIRFE